MFAGNHRKPTFGAEKKQQAPKKPTPIGTDVAFAMPGPGKKGLVSVAAGTLDSQVLDNANSTTQQGEPNHCGILTSATRWFGLQNTNGAGLTFVVDTAGSSVDTVLAAYTGNTLSSLSNVTCAVGPGPASSVSFPAMMNVPYAMAVDGINPAQQGTIHLNWKLGSYPSFVTPPASKFANPGTTVNFSALAGGVPAPKYQWRSNGVDVSKATNSTFSLTNVTAAQSGLYSAVASNFMGRTTSAVARLTVAWPYTLGSQRFATNGLDTVKLLGPANALATNSYIIQATTNFVNWVPLRTNWLPNAFTNYVDPDRAKFNRRFYRLVPYPPLPWF